MYTEEQFQTMLQIIQGAVSRMMNIAPSPRDVDTINTYEIDVKSTHDFDDNGQLSKITYTVEIDINQT